MMMSLEIQEELEMVNSLPLDYGSLLSDSGTTLCEDVCMKCIVVCSVDRFHSKPA